MFLVISKKNIKLIFIVSIVLFISIICYIFLIKSQKGLINTVTKSEFKYIIIVHTDEKKLYLYKNNTYIKQYPIASGRAEWPSPIGDWKIISKDDWGEGFGGRWMGLNVTWGNYGIHGTTDEDTIGMDVSHGCIRMYNRDIKELYDIVPLGTQVIIKNGPFGPFGLGFRELYPGDRGADVLAVQRKLKAMGYFKGYESGIYEDDLKSALHKFQESKQLEVKDTITTIDYNTMGFREFE